MPQIIYKPSIRYDTPSLIFLATYEFCYVILDSTPTPPHCFSQLDDTLRPLQPLPNSQESMLIYYEHVELAEKYVKLQQEKHATAARV